MGDGENFDWFVELLWNLYGYSTVLLPIGIMVYMVKHKHCIPTFSNLKIVRIIVYGRDVNTNGVYDVEQSKQLIDVKKETDEDTKEQDAKNSNRKKLVLFITCFLGLHCSYLIWGVFQEKIMTTEYLISTNRTQFIIKQESLTVKLDKIKFHDSQFLVLINRIFAFLIALVVFTITQARKLPNQSGTPKRLVIAPFHEFFYCSLSNILSSWCQYEALKFVNFPTQVLSKACKIPSVMLMSKLVSNKKYETFEYITSISISFGMILFLHGNHNNDHKNESAITQGSMNSTSKLFNGLIVLACYLIFDSFTSNWEESIYHKYRISSWQMMAAVNLCSVILTLTSLTQQGNLIPALITVTSSNRLLLDCIFLSISSTIGQFFVFFTISHFGALIFAMIMTLRQIFAILLSMNLYHHSISMLSLLGMFVVFASIITSRIMKINKVKK
ncbi:adenosine 3'-phospho 5'-phosphosulfate transporter 1 [Tetranychus urticae]|uniref:Adenosine 3'-phospho 5'-phosphosulfate transporter 1 n=1 Tax=Tetranychus urticae TaxID=32264 RepID=T1KPE6_TETUR|nr:adenosine 3'-phospho 5'-phosphosulfate transporter 1 [Tetranychus urticae]